MKKILVASLVALAAQVQAAGLELDVDQVRDLKTNKTSQAQYLRVDGDYRGVKLGVQARTSVGEKGGMLNSLELTSTHSLFGVKPFWGVGFDNGFNGAHKYQYGLVGASTGFPLGKAYVYGGVKTRVNWDQKNPDQTLAFTGISYALAKDTSVNFGLSRSYQDIKERAWGGGIKVNF